MKQFFRNLFDQMHKSAGDNPYLRTTVDAFDTFLFTPKETTSKQGVQIRDGMDLKRTMFMVVLPLTILYLFGAYNIGQQHYLATGMAADMSIIQKFVYGILQILPMFIVVHAVGLGIEFIFAARRGHAVEEGFLVTGALIPLIMPPSTPLWIVALAVAFSVLIVKEAFGGTGMNIWNVALMARAFVFFAYPSVISGDITPVLNDAGEIIKNNYVWISTEHNILHKLFGGFLNIGQYKDVMQQMVAGQIDAYSGATPLAVAAKEGWAAVESTWSVKELFLGWIPGSIGEMFKPLIILGALFLMGIGIASWRIIVGFVLGMAITGLILNAFSVNVFMEVPWYYHFIIGSALFAMAFMATDPVTASQTNIGKWIYGILIGVVGMIVRVINPAYPEGWMLAILFMNTFAPLIDHMVISRNVKKRVANATN